MLAPALRRQTDGDPVIQFLEAQGFTPVQEVNGMS